MGGNVYEWCWDWYEEEYYKSSEKKNPLGVKKGRGHVVRGSSWDVDYDYCRVAFRNWSYPDLRYSILGFRIFRG